MRNSVSHFAAASRPNYHRVYCAPTGVCRARRRAAFWSGLVFASIPNQSPARIVTNQSPRLRFTGIVSAASPAMNLRFWYLSFQAHLLFCV